MKPALERVLSQAKNPILIEHECIEMTVDRILEIAALK